MPGSAALRLVMLGLVLVNLLFVQLTEAAQLSWLLPLYLLTILSPVLARWRESLVYRTLWNLAVIGVFGLLVKHVLGHHLGYILQDGLVLAVMCQVHLLNNLRDEQRPDLLFINSFLVAAVTGYLCEDLAYAMAFVAYVPLFVIGLQLLCVLRQVDRLAPEPTWRIAVDGMRRSLVLMAFTLGAFLFWPRDFDRSGILSGDFQFDSPVESLEIAFTENLNLDRGGSRAGASGRVVMYVRPLHGVPFGAPSLWRGATLVATDGQEWWKARESDGFAGSGDAWMRWEDTLHRSRGDQAGAQLAIERVDPETDRLFTVLDAGRLDLGEGVDASRIRARSDGTVSYRALGTQPASLEYELTLAVPEAQTLGGDVPADLRRELVRFTSLPGSRTVAEAVDLGERLARRFGEGLEQHELVQRFEEHLSSTYTYAAPGEEEAARSLEEFLDGASGHCEFFASALATLLRSRGIPCRIATGYRGQEWNPEGTLLTLRRRDAHAWVEVFDPEGGWYAVDPVPMGQGDAGPSLWEQTQARLRIAWAKLTSFDSEARAEVFAWLGDLPGLLWTLAGRHPAGASMVALASTLFGLLLRLRRRGGAPAEIRGYKRALQRAGLQLLDGETPRELLERAREGELVEARLVELSAATERHEAARYAA